MLDYWTVQIGEIGKDADAQAFTVPEGEAMDAAIKQVLEEAAGSFKVVSVQFHKAGQE